MDQNDSSTQKISDGKLLDSFEDFLSRHHPGTIFATNHCVVADILVENGMEVNDGDPLLVLDIKETTMPKSTRLTQSYSEDIVDSPVSSESLQSKAVSDEDLDYAQANKKQKVNDIGQTKQVTHTAQSSWRVAEVMVVKGMKVKPWEPLYAMESLDIDV